METRNTKCLNLTQFFNINKTKFLQLINDFRFQAPLKIVHVNVQSNKFSCIDDNDKYLNYLQ